MPREQYFTTRAVYLGWAVPTGVILISAIVASLVLAIVVRGRGVVFWLALAGFVLISATLVVFFIWTEPTNNATNNWTTVPENWRELSYAMGIQPHGERGTDVHRFMRGNSVGADGPPGITSVASHDRWVPPGGFRWVQSRIGPMHRTQRANDCHTHLDDPRCTGTATRPSHG